MQTKRALAGAAAALFLAAGMVVRADDKPVKLARTAKVGDVVRTKVTVNANAGGQDIVVVQTFKTKVKEINKKDEVVWEQTTESVVVNDMEQAGASGQTQTETRDKLNKLVDYTPPKAGQDIFSPEVQKLMAGSSEILFTDKEVKPGDSWTTEMDNPVVKDKKVKIKTTFVGMDKVDGKDYWKVKQSAEADTDDKGAKTTYEMTSWLDPADGSTLKMEGQVKDLPVPQIGSLSWTMKLERLKADKAEKADK